MSSVLTAELPAAAADLPRQHAHRKPSCFGLLWGIRFVTRELLQRLLPHDGCLTHAAPPTHLCGGGLGGGLNACSSTTAAAAQHVLV